MDLQKRFLKLLEAKKVPHDVALQNWISLEKRYSAKNRHYHTLDHIENCLHLFDALVVVDPVLEISIFYHDSVYDVLRTDNEIASALLMRSDLYMCEPKLLHEVDQTIVVTDHTKKPEMENLRAKMMQDIDLAILGEHRDIYARYMGEIRREYSVFGDDQYDQARKKFLEKLLKRPTLYNTMGFQAVFEQRARGNILWEIGQL